MFPIFCFVFKHVSIRQLASNTKVQLRIIAMLFVSLVFSDKLNTMLIRSEVKGSHK